ncbi:hypothetical protein [Ahniella affigens]|uniref:hypothetical protein n=1 Tax=Ahniella affigens TaxID=2021234 RepID=UPI0011B1EDF2|nr:hypothetical protein [Ahniella affigens]
MDWVKGLKSVGESSTYSATEDDGFHRAFCVDAVRLKKHDAYLFFMWNELATQDKGVSVLPMGSPIGRAKIAPVKIDAMDMPGYPSYFCVVPASGHVVNFRYSDRLNGSPAFQRYVTGFLSGFSPMVVRDSAEQTLILGYGIGGTVNPKAAFPLFATGEVRNPANIELLRNRCADIRKVVAKVPIRPVIAGQKTFLDAAREFVFLPVNNRLKASIPFRYEFKTKLTLAQLNTIISGHLQDGDKHVATDIGFTFAKESQSVKWLSGGLARDEIDLNIQFDKHDRLDFPTLAKAIDGSLDSLIKGLQEK